MHSLICICLTVYCAVFQGLAEGLALGRSIWPVATGPWRVRRGETNGDKGGEEERFGQKLAEKMLDSHFICQHKHTSMHSQLTGKSNPAKLLFNYLQSALSAVPSLAVLPLNSEWTSVTVSCYMSHGLSWQARGPCQNVHKKMWSDRCSLSALAH